MAIKYNNSKVKVVNYNGNDVKKIIKDGITVWEKPYTLTEYTIDSSVVTYKWKSTEEPSAIKNGTISKTEKTKNVKYDAEVYNEDTITVTYNTDISKGAVADIIRINGKDVTTTSTDINISDDVEVEVIAAGKPATLSLTMDLGADYAYVRYIDTDGQQRKAYFDEAATHTISDIWQGTTVEYWWYPDAGHTPKSGSPDPKITHKFIANASQSINLETTLKPVSLGISWSSAEGAEIQSVTVRYTDINDVEQTKTVTSPGTIATDVKFRTQYYWTITPKQGSEAVFKYLEDYDVAERNNNTIGIDVDWKPCRIRIDWTQLAPEVSSVRLKYKSAETNGIYSERLYRNSSYSDVEGARCGTTAQLLDFKFTKTGCRVDPLDPDAYKTLSDDPTVTNIFTGLTVEVLDLDERETPVSFTVPSDYEKVEITYINTEGKEVTVVVTGGSKIEDMAEGSYIHYSASTKGGNTYSGYLHSGYDWSTGSSTTSSVTIPSESTIKKRPAMPGDNYVYTWNESAWAWEKVKVDTPRRRTVNITVNENVGQICMNYYSVDDNDYLMHYSYRRFSTNDSVTALAGRSLSWHLHNSTIGGQTTPDRESFNPLRESKNPLVIAPTWTLAYGSIHLVFGENINTITVKYYNTLTNQKEVTISYTNAVSGLYDITDAVLGKYFTWSATSRDGMVLDRDHGSGYADPDYVWLGAVDGRADRCAIIAPEIDTEPVKIYFSGDYADWMSTKLEAALNEQLIATYNGSSAAIECKTKQGVSRWYNQVDRLQNTDSRVYTGDASFDKTFPIILNSTTAPWNDSTRKYELRINTNGYSSALAKYTVARPSLPTGSEAWSSYVSSNPTAAGGDPSNAEYGYGTTVYWFISYPYKYYTYYNKPSSWVEISKDQTSNYITYRVASATVDENSPTTTPFTPNDYNYPTPKAYTISLDQTYSGYGAWTDASTGATVTSKTAYYGDKLIYEGGIVGCQAPDGRGRWGVSFPNLPAQTFVDVFFTGTLSIKSSINNTALSSSGTTVAANQTLNLTGWTKNTRQYKVTLSPASLTAVSSLFLSENSMATTGDASGSQFYYNKTVYGIAKVPTSSLATYAVPSGSSGWTYKQTSGDYAYYTVGSVKVDGNPATGETISVSALTVKGSFTITLDGTGLVWKQGNTIKTSMTAYKNDTITRVSSTAVACSYMNASGGLAERWRVTVSRAPDTNTTTYSGTPSIPNFSSWTVTSDKKLSELFTVSGVSSATRKYTVTWKTQDGTSTYETDSVAYNTGPDYNGATPGKTATAQYNYTFAGWSTSKNAESGTADTSLPKVTGNVTYYAAFSKTVRKYTVTWKNWDGTVLETDNNVTYGTTPTYNGSTPTRAADTNYTYTFKGWSPTVSAVNGATTYTATYSSSTRSYTITFKDSNAATWSSASKTAYPGDALSKRTTGNTAALICSYKDSNGNLAQRWKVSVLVKSATAQYTYTVNNWDFLVPSSTVNGDMTVTAPSGSVTTNKYTVKIVATTGVSSTFISTSSTAKSGTNTTSGASMSYSTTTYYGFVKVLSSVILQYNLPTDWERVGIDGSYTIYKVWSGKITGNINYNPGSMTPKTGTVTVSKADYMYGIYLSTSATTAPGSGSASGSTFNMGTTVYAIAMFTSDQYSAISSKPSTWGTVNYNGSYYYCSVGSVTVIEGANTITYTAPTLKSKLPAPSASVKVTGSNYVAEIHSNTNVTTAVYVTWYNASTNVAVGTATVSPGSYGTATTTLALTKASSVYVKAYATNGSYLASDTTKSTTCYQPTLSDPVLAGYSASSGYTYKLTVKNNNSVAVTCCPEYGNNITIAANSTGTVTFTSSSSSEYVRCYFTASGYQDSDVVDWYVEYTPPSSGGTTR